ncbi:MAG: hypothetical protein A7315_08670 [Candidatus Altiarchaeales archaeon WOR_SM1_79]|nr:MAG: hypothetical protein A7315_08670 [Candidatus Altiarchaeales archaeon WOR_SM1_79]
MTAIKIPNCCSSPSFDTGYDSKRKGLKFLFNSFASFSASPEMPAIEYKNFPSPRSSALTSIGAS